jgi:hypothetical protein
MLITERKFGIFKILNIYFVNESFKNNFQDWDFVRYCTYKNLGEINGFERYQFSTTTIDLSQNIDVIWNKIKRHHKRHIRRAEKNGTQVKVSHNYEGFYQNYKKFLKQKNYADILGLSSLSPQFMQKYGILFVAENQGESLGGNLYFHDNNSTLLTRIFYQNFENSLEKNIYDANCFIHWEAIQYFKNRDFSNYDLGGLNSGKMKIDQQMPGLDFFKLSFGGDIIQRYEYRKFSSKCNKLLFHSKNALYSLI